MVRTKHTADCHPDLPLVGRGMCRSCYSKWWTAEHPKPPKPRYTRPRKMSDCHPDRLHSGRGMCKSCYRRWYKATNQAYKDRQAVYRLEHPNSRSQVSSSLMNAYGLSQADRDAKVLLQGGLCAICGTPPDGNGNASVLHVDHDHETGDLRGMLCTRCNVGLGMFRDDFNALAAASQYIYAYRPLV